MVDAHLGDHRSRQLAPSARLGGHCADDAQHIDRKMLSKPSCNIGCNLPCALWHVKPLSSALQQRSATPTHDAHCPLGHLMSSGVVEPFAIVSDTSSVASGGVAFLFSLGYVEGFGFKASPRTSQPIPRWGPLPCVLSLSHMSSAMCLHRLPSLA